MVGLLINDFFKKRRVIFYQLYVYLFYIIGKKGEKAMAKKAKLLEQLGKNIRNIQINNDNFMLKK